MGVLRVERHASSGLSAKASGVAWRDYDIQLTVYAVLLAAIGLAMAYSHTTAQLGEALVAGTTFARGLVWAVVALVVYAAATAFDYRWLRTLTWPIYVANLGLLAATLALGDADAASSRWISVLGFQFQFSELAKILMIIVLARYLADRESRLDSLGSILGACLLVVPAWVLVMLQPDLGTSLVFIAILAGMLFMAGARLRWLVLLGAAALAAIPLAWTFLLHDYQKVRLTSFLDPAADPLGAGYQLLTAQEAVRSGGLLGYGITNGAQNQAQLLPVQTTDFVFAILAEELGFVGCLVVFGLFIALLWRILLAAWRSRDPLGLLVGAGLASMILFQLAVNVGMIIGIMPITGIPLPFITHGGSSLVSIALGLGILQSINVRRHRPEW
jgi:rod shape determining protein RodA